MVIKCLILMKLKTLAYTYLYSVIKFRNIEI